MSLLQGLLLAAGAALVALHMASPRFLKRRLSAARFFHDLPPADDKRRRFNLGNPLRSRPLYPQLLMMGFLAAALLYSEGCERQTGERLGVHVFLDTSYSMTALQDGTTRLDAARAEARRFLDTARGTGGELAPCFRLSAFDLELRTPWAEPMDGPTAAARLDEFEARALGTDFALLRNAAGVGEGEGSEGRPLGGSEGGTHCPAQVRLVISDLPAPDWAGEPGSGWIWRDIGRPLDNIGLTALTAVRDPFGGHIEAVAVEVAAYGTPPPDAALEVLDPAGVAATTRISWPAEGRGHHPWHHEIAVAEAGIYRLRLEPGDAYIGDDEATFEVPSGSQLSVDWRLGDAAWSERFGWRRLSAEEAKNADLVVLSPGQDAGQRPALVVGDQYGRVDQEVQEIGFFEADSDLLDGLSFDIAEAAGIAGISVPADFEPVLTGRRFDSDVWVARRSAPPGVYLPGLPTGGDDPLGRFSAALFIQSLRWLLLGTPPPPLYTLTSPADPQPSGTRIALHDGEGKTDHRPLSRGDVDEMISSARAPSTAEEPSWPWWLAAAAAVFLLDQVLLGFAGEGWR